MQIRPDFICIKCHMQRQAVVLILSVLTTVSGSHWAQRRGAQQEDVGLMDKHVA